MSPKFTRWLAQFNKDLRTYKVEAKAIQKYFDRHFELLGQPKRPVVLYDENIPVFKMVGEAVLKGSDDKKVDAARGAARGAAWDAARDAARDAAWDAAWGAAWDAAWDAARDAAWGAAWGAASFEACDKNDNCKICIYRAIEHQIYLAFKNGVFTYWVLTDKVVVIQRPKIREENNRLHSDVGPAIEWKNEVYFYLNGVKFGKELWEKVVAGRMSFKDILDIQNTEQRLQAMRYNPNALLETGAKKVHETKRDNQLYLIENHQINKIYDEPKVWLLRFRDPSKLAPNNWMIEEVDPKVAEVSPDADVVQAYHLGLTHEEYKLLKMET